MDGKPTGLHRYVGEQRFVFALLNVTDGAGDAVSYDLETKDGDSVGGEYYADASGNGLRACHVGDTPVSRAVFGGGVSLSGSGSSLSACGPNPSGTLNTIDQSFTVAFWVRPDVDYASGSGWHWSFGRQNLWRFGSYGAGLRLEVWNPSGTSYSLDAPVPLYAGRWVHVAAVVQHQEPFGGVTWPILSVYANGELAASCGCGPGAVKTGTSSLYLAWDEASGFSPATAGRFKGTVDEFRLYRTPLSPDSVRGLRWFAKGSNSVVVPRGVLYDSLLFAKMTNTSSDLMSGPLAGANVHANDNNGSAHLNARAIQMVIDKNLTLADAYNILGLLGTNKTGNETAFAFGWLYVNVYVYVDVYGNRCPSRRRSYCAKMSATTFCAGPGPAAYRRRLTTSSRRRCSHERRPSSEQTLG